MKNDAQAVAKMIGILVCRARGFLEIETAPNLGLNVTRLPSGGSPLVPRFSVCWIGNRIRLLGIFVITTTGV